MRDDAIDLVTNSAWVGRTADAIGDAVKHAYASAGERGVRVKSALNGVWLGHPLHSVLTDVPLGAWTVAVACDATDVATGRNEFGECARAAITVGLVGALASAVAGMTDWSDTDGHARRVDLLHGTVSVTATWLLATSLALRQRAHTGRGRLWALAGYAVALGAAYLGGDLVYGQQIGVNHAATHPQPWFEVRVRSGQIEVRMPRPPEEPALEQGKGAAIDWRAAS
ncbi:MAG: DUF2231 domain-containing protein [Deltaproteobacteria bacterium]